MSEKVILLRLGLLPDNKCPVDRYALGIGWRALNSAHSYHSSISKLKTLKHRVNLEMALKINKYINSSNNIFYPI